jgi:hypothetical protein
MSQEPDWLKQARQTAEYHRSQRLTHDKKWTLTQTAKALRRSLGSICEDILIAKESRVYDLEVFEFQYEALNFIRMKKKERELEE